MGAGIRFYLAGTEQVWHRPVARLDAIGTCLTAPITQPGGGRGTAIAPFVILGFIGCSLYRTGTSGSYAAGFGYQIRRKASCFSHGAGQVRTDHIPPGDPFSTDTSMTFGATATKAKYDIWCDWQRVRISCETVRFSTTMSFGATATRANYDIWCDGRSVTDGTMRNGDIWCDFPLGWRLAL